MKGTKVEYVSECWMLNLVTSSYLSIHLISCNHELPL